VSVMQYADDGFLPEALVNFLARLGWSHGDDEYFTRRQLIEWFDVAHIHPSPARFDADKLRWLNHEHIRRLPEAELGARLAPYLARAGLDVTAGPSVAAVAALLRDRATTLAEMAQQAEYFYRVTVGVKEVQQNFAAKMDDVVRQAVADLRDSFRTVDWNREAIGASIKSTAARHGLKPPQVMMAVRTLVTGTPQTPSIDAVLTLVGRERTVERLALAKPTGPH